jgi:hypothetical protein
MLFTYRDRRQEIMDYRMNIHSRLFAPPPPAETSKNFSDKPNDVKG